MTPTLPCWKSSPEYFEVFRKTNILHYSWDQIWENSSTKSRIYSHVVISSLTWSKMQQEFQAIWDLEPLSFSPFEDNYQAWQGRRPAKQKPWASHELLICTSKVIPSQREKVLLSHKYVFIGIQKCFKFVLEGSTNLD